jgi:inorganic pyrophosphatase
MVFPYDFGFVPSTEAEGGDPDDVLVLMDEPAFTGCMLKCRIIGIIEGEQGGKKKRKEMIVSLQLNRTITVLPTLNTLTTWARHFSESWKSFCELPQTV